MGTAIYSALCAPTAPVPVLDGTGPEIDSAVLGRYDNAAGPGEDGNLSLAGHRQTYGAVLWDMDTLQEGDRMYLQTANGWWVYETRQVHIVEPTAVEVLDPNPMNPGGPADGMSPPANHAHHLPPAVHGLRAYDHPRRTSRFRPAE